MIIILSFLSFFLGSLFFFYKQRRSVIYYRSQGIASLSTVVDFLSPVSAGMVRSSISWLIGPS